MTSSTFQPYGLITTPLLEALYFRAHIANIYTGIADPKEYETSALMGEILNTEFSEEHFTVSSQYPPAPQSPLRADYAVRYLEHGGDFQIKILLIDEDKRANTSQPFSLKALETQAKRYCAVCLESEPKTTTFLYAITAAGAHVRLWTYSRDTNELRAFWGSHALGNWSQYRDVGKDNDAEDIRYFLGHMKRFPPTPHAGHTSDTYGGGTGLSDQVSSASASYQVPTSSASYTVPIIQNDPASASYQVPTSSSSYTVLQQDPASVHTETGVEQPSSPSGSLGEASGKPSLPAGAIKVEVMVQPRRKNGDLYHFYDNGIHHKVDEGNWYAYIKEDRGQHWDCVATWVSEQCFYTWDLNHAQTYADAFASDPQASVSDYPSTQTLDASAPSLQASVSDYQARASTQALDSSGQDAQRDSKFVIVPIRVQTHKASKDEIIFKNTRGIETSTKRSDWDKIKYDGKTAWQYETKRHTYISFDKAINH